MRCYHFGNYYLSSIQQGIQASHSQMELFVKYKETSDPNQDKFQREMLYDWSYFCEDEYSLGGILTNVAIVLPEKIYDAAEKIRNKQASFSDNSLYANVEHGFISKFTNFEVKLIEILNKCALAR